MQPVTKRVYQAINLCIVAAFGERVPVYHLVEHPKCGGSWIRNMIQHYIGGEPYLGGRLISRNTVIQVHRLYSRIYCNPVVVFRDPRDVFVSFYYHERRAMEQGQEPVIAKYYKFDNSRSREDDFAAYLQAKLEHCTDPGFSYGEFVESWLEKEGTCSVLYEDVLEDPSAELTRIVRFLKQAVKPELIAEIIDYHKFENETKRRYGASRKPGTEDTQKFQRKGISGDWKNHFNERACELMQVHEWQSIHRLGYESDDGWVMRYLESRGE